MELKRVARLLLSDDADERAEAELVIESGEVASGQETQVATALFYYLWAADGRPTQWRVSCRISALVASRHTLQSHLWLVLAKKWSLLDRLR